MDFRTELERRKGQRDQVLQSIAKDKKKIKRLKKKGVRLEEAQQIIQAVAQRTQQELEFHVSELVSLALEATFPKDPYKFNCEFVMRRGKTEADLTFSPRRNLGIKLDPLGDTGGGACDIASCALRFSVWSLSNPRTRPLFVLDEPFKNLNDPSRRLHRQAAEMLREVVDRLRIQIVMVTLLPELMEVADKKFEVTKNKKGVSKVKEEGG